MRTKLRNISNYIIGKFVNGVYNKELYNIDRVLRKRSLERTAIYVEENMKNAIGLKNRIEIIKFLKEISNDKNNKLHLGFALYDAKMINTILKKIEPNILYCFENVKGLEEDWKDYKKGNLKNNFSMKFERKNVKLVIGDYKENIKKLLNENKQKCELVYLDCNTYNITKEVLNVLKERIVKDTILFIYDYFNYLGWEEGQFKAFQEFVKENNIKYKYLAYEKYGYTVAIKIK